MMFKFYASSAFSATEQVKLVDPPSLPFSLKHAKLYHAMKQQAVIDYWLSGAQDDLDTADKLFKAKKYHHCLFFAHLSLEKILKALIVKKTGKHALPIHSLKKLAMDASFKLSQKKEKELREITTFNIEARYNSYKLAFFKKATKEYAQKWLKKTKEIYQWIEKML